LANDNKKLGFYVYNMYYLKNMKLVVDKYKQLKTIIRIVAGIKSRLTLIFNCKYNRLANLSTTLTGENNE
tara:strand:- start:2259 stop:2468 length:210 start_codon:yes stop_codon:yes gene_type:complete